MCKDVKYNKEHEPGGGDTRCHKHLLTLLQVVDACGEKIAESSCCDSVPDAVTAVPLMHADPKYGLLYNPFYILSPQPDLGQFCIENCTHYLKQVILQERYGRHGDMKACTKCFFSPVLQCFPSASRAKAV